MSAVEARFAALPPPRERCVASVALPARDEAPRIRRALAALTAQRDLDGAALDPDAYEILVFANGCSDATERIAARFRDQHPLHAIYVVAAGRAEPECAHIGTVRRAVMDAATARLIGAGRPHAAVLTTDADSSVAPDWIARTLAALQTADAVGGRILLDPLEMSGLDPGARALNDLQNRYDFALAHLESLVDPLPHDPWPRHAQRFGASFALQAATYVRAGGVPERDHLEDLALYHALLRIDARFRHSMHVRVVTSPRLGGRVAGGLGTFLTDLHSLAEAKRPLLREAPETSREIVDARAALRRWWALRDHVEAGAHRAEVMRLFALDPAAWRESVAHAFTFGAAFAAAHACALERGLATRRTPVPIADAVAGLEAQGRALRASASWPTRSTARSGAG